LAFNFHIYVGTGSFPNAHRALSQSARQSPWPLFTETAVCRIVRTHLHCAGRLRWVLTLCRCRMQ